MRHERNRDRNIRSGIMNGTLVRLGRGESCFWFQTRSRAYDKSNRFLIVANTFAKWLDDSPRGFFYDSDAGSFVRIRKDEQRDSYRVRITWLSSSGDQIYGHEENVTIPCAKLDAIVNGMEGAEIVCLSIDRPQKSKLDFSKSGETIRGICECGKTKRAFLKAIRDILRWKSGGSYTYYPDFALNSFFFQADGYCGGLIQHKGNKKTPAGDFPYVYFGEHT